MSDRPNALLRLGPIEAPQAPQNALAPQPTWADAYDYNARAYTDWVARERAKGVELGTIDPQTGWPTKAGYLDAVQQYGNALLLGTSAPGPKLSLERTTLPKEWAQPNNHKFTINRAGEEVGSVHTEYNPQTGELYVQDIESAGGPNAYGPAALRQLREALLEHYPEARTISGYRSTGAGAGRETWQRIKQYQGQ